MRNGVLVLDKSCGRMDIRFGLNEYYGGLHCGTCFEVLIEDKWVQTRIEMSPDNRWFLVGISTYDLVGLLIRIK